MKRTFTLIALLFLLSSAAFAGDLISTSGHRPTRGNSAMISVGCASPALAAAFPNRILAGPRHDSFVPIW